MFAYPSPCLCFWLFTAVESGKPRLTCHRSDVVTHCVMCCICLVGDIRAKQLASPAPSARVHQCLCTVAASRVTIVLSMSIFSIRCSPVKLHNRAVHAGGRTLICGLYSLCYFRGLDLMKGAVSKIPWPVTGQKSLECFVRNLGVIMNSCLLWNHI